MENIILIGMPGAGKSTVGVVLAKIMGYSFIDSDLLIQEQEQRLLHEIIQANGVEAFLEIENQVNASIQVKHTVIATGGSVVYCKEAMEHLKSIGTVLYLKLPFEPLADRLQNIEGRGIALREGQSLYDLYVERTKLYEAYADLVLEEDGLSVEETLAKILEILQ